VSGSQRAAALLALEGFTGREIERRWWADGKQPRELWKVLDKWAREGWWDYGMPEGGGLTEDGREALLLETR
jgi:hypothetical protein